MKKLLVFAAVAALTTPIFAGDNNEQEGPQHFKGPRQEMVQNPEFKAQMEAKKAEMQAQREKMKATEEKMQKLVKDYKKAKDGSKKQVAAREEIGKLLGEVRADQITFREKQIAAFEKRLEDMKTRLNEENAPEAKEAWTNKMTDRVIEKDGDLKKVFAPGKRGPKGHFKGGPKRHGKRGYFKGGQKHPPVDILPMPPAPQEEK